MLEATDSRVPYTLLVGAVAVGRLAELAVARRNERRLRARGAVEFGASHYPWMVALHSAFLAACVAEVWRFDRPPWPPLVPVALGLLALAWALRYWVIATLAGRWTTRVVCLPGEPLVTGGPYRFLRHPNYLAVAVEIAALPLVHGAWATAAIFSALNALLLRHRIAVEERALARSAPPAGRRP